jgi:ribulose-phosphate 3-epimerase
MIAPSTKTPFPLARKKVRIAPSILSADFGRLSDAVQTIERAGAEMVHLDVMDGHFVPNISFGVPVIKSLRKHSKLFFDAHLMIQEPQRYAEPFVKAGCDLITFHIEVTNEPQTVVDQIRSLGAFAGVSINPTTPVSAIESILDTVDLVLVMSVWPGFGGQKFMGEVLDKVRDLRTRLRPDQRLEIDGGIDPQTIGAAAAAGADTFVAGTAVFGTDDPSTAMGRLLDLANSASI